MSTFIQIHSLRCYPPSNLNRDEDGAPKIAEFGDSTRLRISSQCLKKNYREAFMGGDKSTRTTKLPQKVFEKLCDGGIPASTAKKVTVDIFKAFFDIDKDPFKKPKKGGSQDLALKQITTFTPEEMSAIYKAVDARINEVGISEECDLFSENLSAIKDITKKTKSLDVACFGRMLAGSEDRNMEAAVQVSHALSANSCEVEDEFFTAVDDLNAIDEMGSAHMGYREFGSGVFYHYMNINTDTLRQNLDQIDVEEAVREIIRVAIVSEPTGYQNSFASRTIPIFFRVEVGDDSPTNLAMAYFNAMSKEAQLDEYVSRLKETSDKFKKSFGGNNKIFDINTLSGEGSMDELLDESICAMH